MACSPCNGDSGGEGVSGTCFPLSDAGTTRVSTSGALVSLLFLFLEVGRSAQVSSSEVVSDSLSCASHLARVLPPSARFSGRGTSPSFIEAASAESPWSTGFSRIFLIRWTISGSVLFGASTGNAAAVSGCWTISGSVLFGASTASTRCLSLGGVGGSGLVVNKKGEQVLNGRTNLRHGCHCSLLDYFRLRSDRGI